MRQTLNQTTMAAAFVALALLAPMPASAQLLADVDGYVDGTTFVEMVGEDGVTVEVNLHGPLLRALTAFDPDLKRLVGGLESIHAVVIDLDDREAAARVGDTVSALEKKLRGRGWERLATVRERNSRVTVLVLNDDETIRGLTVMSVDGGELAFANIAGVIDLAAISELGEAMDLPGLDALDGAGR